VGIEMSTIGGDVNLLRIVDCDKVAGEILEVS
jgi:hypothetical protein